jgi:predicted Holliday junction resolvase-like endonuclease
MIEYIIIAILLIFMSYVLHRMMHWKEIAEELAQKHRSQSVKHGILLEQFVPFMQNFPYQKEQFTFLGKPIDGIVFGDDEVVFMEFKTGKSQLSAKQKHVRDLVERKRVVWKELRY